MLEIHAGTDRAVILFCERAFKVPMVSLRDSVNRALRPERETAIYRELRLNYFKGRHANLIEAQTWERTGSDALVPARVFFGGALIVQQRGTSLRQKCENKWYLDPIDTMLASLCKGDPDLAIGMSHTLGNTSNYVFNASDQLQLCDYGDQRVGDFIIKNQHKFEAAMRDARAALREIGI